MIRVGLVEVENKWCELTRERKKRYQMQIKKRINSVLPYPLDPKKPFGLLFYFIVL